MKILFFDFFYIMLAASLFVSWYLLRPLRHSPQPARLQCLNESDGKFKTLPMKPKNIFGIGLSYANHIAETAHEFDAQSGPMVFIKERESLLRGGGVTELPSDAELIEVASMIDATLEAKLRSEFPQFTGLFDYEAELGFILLESIKSERLADPNYVPKLGFFIANDLSARALQVLGEGMPNRLDYWGMAKSLEAFLPVSKRIWVPAKSAADAIPCVMLETRVNGELRQREKTSGLIYTPREMMQAALRQYPKRKLSKGDMFISGTPAGIALATPRWKARLSSLLRFDRFKKLKYIFKSDLRPFLKAGDEVIVSGEWLGEVSTRLE